MKATAALICTLLLVACAPKSERSHWLILETTEAGRPVIVSARKDLPSPEVRRQFPWATTIEWFYPVGERGMPSDELLKSMYAFEDRLETQVVMQQLSMLALTRTGNGLREWTYYAKEKGVAENQITSLAKASPAHTIRVKVHEEPTWSSLQDVLSNVREAKP